MFKVYETWTGHVTCPHPNPNPKITNKKLKENAAQTTLNPGSTCDKDSPTTVCFEEQFQTIFTTKVDFVMLIMLYHEISV